MWQLNPTDSTFGPSLYADQPGVSSRAISPDGHSFVFPDDLSNRRMHMTSEDGVTVALTDDDGESIVMEQGPAWSLDGTSVAYTRSRGVGGNCYFEIRMTRRRRR